MTAYSSETILFLRSQLEGLESIFFELLPFDVSLTRQDIQEYYDFRYNWATNPFFAADKIGLRNQFNTKANQVRNIVDGAETLGNAHLHFNLIYIGSSLPGERHTNMHALIIQLCKQLLEEGSFDLEQFKTMLSSHRLLPAEARTLLSSAMFTTFNTIAVNEVSLPASDLLRTVYKLLVDVGHMSADDPFAVECSTLLETCQKVPRATMQGLRQMS